jgi:D-lactate dehydrogenase (cytochrome)
LKLLEISQTEAAGTLTSFELIADICIDFCVKHGPNIRDPLSGKHLWYVLMEISSQRDDARDTMETILSRAMEDGLVDDAVIAANLDQRAAFWKLREVISPVQKSEGGSIKHDVSVPVAAVPDLIAEANAAVVKLIPGARPFPFGHLGDGNIHYNVSQPVDGDKAAFMARWNDVHDVVHGIVARLGGSISAEHGIGVMKRNELPHFKDTVALDVMRTLKTTFDPLNILNPGKIV